MRWCYNRHFEHEVVSLASRLPPLTLYPKRVFSLNDSHCVALKLILRKYIEKLVNQHIKASVPTSQDPHPFAFRINRSTEDDTCSNLHAIFRPPKKYHHPCQDAVCWFPFSWPCETLGLSTTLCWWGVGKWLGVVTGFHLTLSVNSAV